MTHALKLFVAHARVLQRYQAIVPAARLYTLTAGATLAVLPLDDALHDALHKAYGTGEWIENSVALTLTDLAFATRVSDMGPLALIETGGGTDTFAECAALWIGGKQSFKSMWLDRATAGNRPRATWPINAALRGLGLHAMAGLDEFDTFGLGLYPTNETVAARALSLRI